MPDSLTTLPAPEISMETGNGFIVVARFKLPKPVIPPYAFDYSYHYYADLGDAADHYADLERGEYHGWEPVSILPALNGRPLGSKPLGPVTLARLVRAS